LIQEVIQTDPLLAGSHLSLAAFVIVAVRVVAAFGALLVAVMFMIWFERKVISDMQNRIGPNRAGPYGLLQTLADGIKLFFKEGLIPEGADRFVYRLAPYLSAISAFLVFAVVPVGGVVTVAGHRFELQVMDPPMGILFLLAISSLAVYGVMLAGWASGSKYPLLGAIRASAQMISYEAATGLAVATVVLVTAVGGGDSSLSTRAIVESQATSLLHWNIFRTGVVPFLIFLAAATAEVNRPPFDMVEAEQELVAGFNTEYSSIGFALFYLAEFMNTVTMSALAVTLFFGGPDGPGFHFARFLWPILWFVGKTLVFLFVFVWFRGALPRLRYDQLMDLGWKVMIPLGLGWMLLVAAPRASSSLVEATLAAGVVFVAGTLAGALIARALEVGRERDPHRLRLYAPNEGRLRPSLEEVLAGEPIPRARGGAADG
jgi:NADH-quinone oxidoreductase subunit H